MLKDKAGKNRASPSGVTVILPSTPMPEKMLTSLQPPGPDGKIEQKGPPLAQIFKEMKRTWFNGLYIKNSDLSQLDKIKVKITLDGKILTNPRFTNFTLQNHEMGARELSENTVLCKVNEQVGWGLYVREGKILNKGVFIPVSGEIDFTLSEIKTNRHAFGFVDMRSDHHEVIALIDPIQNGGLLDLINHAFSAEELEQVIEFKDTVLAQEVATANLRTSFLIHHGFRIFGIEVTETITSGQQLLWSYSRPREFIGDSKKTLQLFSKKNGKAISPDQYKFKKIQLVVKYKSTILLFITTEIWKINKQLHPERDETVHVNTPNGEYTFMFPISLIQEALIKHPETVLLILSNSQLENCKLIQKQIRLDLVKEAYNKPSAVNFWIEGKLPANGSWKVFLQKNGKFTALIPTSDEQAEAYTKIFKSLPKNCSAGFAKTFLGNQLHTGFIVADWEALSELPSTPLPGCSASSSSSATTSSALPILSITNSGIDPLKASHYYGLSQRSLAFDNLDVAEDFLRKACKLDPANKTYLKTLDEVLAEKSKISVCLRS